MKNPGSLLMLPLSKSKYTVTPVTAISLWYSACSIHFYSHLGCSNAINSAAWITSIFRMCIQPEAIDQADERQPSGPVHMITGTRTCTFLHERAATMAPSNSLLICCIHTPSLPFRIWRTVNDTCCMTYSEETGDRILHLPILAPLEPSFGLLGVVLFNSYLQA